MQSLEEARPLGQADAATTSVPPVRRISPDCQGRDSCGKSPPRCLEWGDRWDASGRYWRAHHRIVVDRRRLKNGITPSPWSDPKGPGQRIVPRDRILMRPGPGRRMQGFTPFRWPRPRARYRYLTWGLPSTLLFRIFTRTDSYQTALNPWS